MSKVAISLFILTFSLNFVFAKDPVIFDVRRQLSLKNGEVAPKDYYLSVGSKDGLKENMLVTVVRRQALYDAYKNQSPGELVVAVGQLRIIHVQPEISVARVENLQKGENQPGLDFDAVMVGDRVDLTSAKMAPRKTASVEVPQTKFELLATPLALPMLEGSADISSNAPTTPATAPL